MSRIVIAQEEGEEKFTVSVDVQDGFVSCRPPINLVPKPKFRASMLIRIKIYVEINSVFHVIRKNSSFDPRLDKTKQKGITLVYPC